MPQLTSPRRARALLLSLSLVLAFACATTQPLDDPAPMAAAPSPAQTRLAILRALLESNYKIESDQPGQITARYSRSDWSMVVGITYSNEVAVRYVSSVNLGYGTEDGKTVIHRGYNMRVQRLARVIGTEIAIANVDAGLPAVTAPPPGNANPQ